MAVRGVLKVESVMFVVFCWPVGVCVCVYNVYEFPGGYGRVCV